MRYIASCITIVVLLLGLGTAEATVTLVTSSGGWDYAGVDDKSVFPSDGEWDLSNAIPYGPVDLKASVASSHAITRLSRTQSSFDYVFDLVRPTALGSWAQSSGFHHFTVDHDTSYAVAGALTRTGTDSVFFSVILQDVSTGAYLLDESQGTYGYVDLVSTLTLGPAAEPPQVYSFAGNLTGQLVRGDTYALWYKADIYAEHLDGTTASAAGDLSLTFGVPEPCSLLVWSGLGALGFVIARRRRKPAA